MGSNDAQGVNCPPNDVISSSREDHSNDLRLNSMAKFSSEGQRNQMVKYFLLSSSLTTVDSINFFFFFLFKIQKGQLMHPDVKNIEFFGYSLMIFDIVLILPGVFISTIFFCNHLTLRKYYEFSNFSKFLHPLIGC